MTALSIGRAINLGVGAIVFALLALAGMFLSTSRTITGSVDVISVQSSAAARAVYEMDRLLANVHHEFTLFISQSRPPRDLFPATAARLNARLESLGTYDPRLSEPAAAIARRATSAARLWSDYFIGKPWSAFSRDSLDRTLAAVSRELFAMRETFAEIAGVPDLAVPRNELERTLRLIARCELLVERFRSFPDLRFRPIMQSIAALRAIVASETPYGDARTAASERARAIDAIAQFEHALLLLADEERSGVTSTTEALASRASEAHANLLTSIDSLREAASTRIARIRSQATNAIDSSRRVTVMAVVACALVAIAFAFALRRYLKGRLSVISRGVDAFTRGELRARIAAESTDELGALATAFNKMAETLATREQERRQHIADIEAARRDAESANTAKSQFLAAMSHEIRTPMNGVLGMAELLSMEPLPPNQRTFVESIQHSGQALLAVINDILDFSKIEAGHLDLDPQPFALRPMVEEIGQLLAPGAHKKGLELAVVIDHTLQDQYIGDAARLRQILINLVGNAVKFTHEGTVTVRIGGTRETGGGQRLRFEVIDTGVGIAKEAQRRIFEPFAQVRHAARGTGGTGLGLPISHNLIAKMGGRLCLESTPGRGTTFWFELLLAIATNTSATDDAAFPAAFRDLRVLVLSAHAETRAGLEQQLIRLGIQHTALASGRVACQLLAQREPSGTSVVLIDSHLSDMDGMAFARSLRSELGPACVDRVALCLVGQEQTRDAVWKAANVRMYLTKPVSQSRLYDCLSELSGAQRALAASATHGPDRGAADAPPRFDARVLVAEDHPVNQLVTVQMLERLGCTAVVAADGARAVELLNAQRFDLVLMDCDMPVMDGFEATAQIRRGEQASGHRPTRIVALTANALRGDRERCLAAGMDDYLGKPFSAAGLNQVLERHLQPRHGAEPGAAETRLVTDPPDVAGDDPDVPVLDGQLLESLQDFGPEFVSSLIDTFVESSARDLECLRRAAATRDADSTRQAAHRMKSSSANVGARRLSARCADLERQARNNRVDALVESLAMLESDYRKALDALEARALVQTP